MSSKQLAVTKLGVYEVQTYERVKRFYMEVGHRMPAALLAYVGGRVAGRGEGCDGITRLGKWEFATQGNTKGKAGDQHDRERCPGMCVQVFGRPKTGWISGIRFLELHDVVEAEQALIDLTKQVEDEIIVESQLRLPI